MLQLGFSFALWSIYSVHSCRLYLIAMAEGRRKPTVRVVYCHYDQDEPVVKIERRSSKIGLFGTAHSVLKETPEAIPEEPLSRAEQSAQERARKLAKEQARKYHKLAAKVVVSPSAIRLHIPEADSASIASADSSAFGLRRGSGVTTTVPVSASNPTSPRLQRGRSISAAADSRQEAILARQATGPMSSVLSPLATQAPNIRATAPDTGPHQRHQLQARMLQIGSSQSLDSAAVDEDTERSSRRAGEERLSTGDLPHLQFFPAWESPFEMCLKSSKKRQQLCAHADEQCRQVHRQTQKMVGKVDQVMRKDSESQRKTLETAARKSLKMSQRQIQKSVKDETEQRRQLKELRDKMNRQQNEHMAKVEIRHHKRLLDLLLTRLHVMEEVQRQHYADLRSFDTSVFESDLTQRVTTATKELAAQLKTARKSHKPLKFDAGDGHKLSKAELNEQAKVFEARLEREADAKRRAFDTDLDVSRAQLQAVYAEIDGKMREFYQRQKDDFASFSPRSSLDASVT
eukprot:TRINITY_DN9006_c0_g1_i4.p1 TRINITY_DN9006_c0_g1~~TRINITY_DN9006_c0_g1_i4.p1  ORF type:complete len:516 (+),score=99.71 TRINITY_DN9006_c0_g1_i4:207-1754(+)